MGAVESDVVEWGCDTTAGEEDVKRYKNTGEGSFFDDLVYDEAVPADHFLRHLKRVVSWSRFTEELIELYDGRGEVGRPPYEPVLLLKMLLLSSLYNLPEREVERYVGDSLSAKWFLGLAVNERAPDHSTLTKLKRRIRECGKEQCLKTLLETVIQEALTQGVVFGSVQIVDSTHTQADVNAEKEDQRRKDGRPPRDGDAQIVVKGKRRGKDEQGRLVAREWRVHGYKLHASMNAGSELITSVVITPANAADGKQFLRLVERDREQGLPVATYAADRGYDDGENHFTLESEGLHSAIRLKDSRTHRKDGHEDVWLQLQATAEYQEGQAERYKIERKFGEAKAHHGLGRCRSVGWFRYAIQAYMTVIALNLKRMVRVLTGAAFGGRARAGMTA